nr:PREDICTED: cytochrome P450 4c3-like [Bemisia tabaci]
MDIGIQQLKLSHILWICLISIFAIRALYRRWKHRKIYAFMASLPGPVSLPFIGGDYILIGISRTNLCGKMKTLTKWYPDGVSGMWERNEPHVLTSRREVLNAVLSSSENIDKFYHYDHFQIVANSMITASGTEWRTIRNIVNPGFRSNILSLFDDNFTYHTRAFVDRLEKYENSDEFDIFVPVHLCTIDLISDNMVQARIGVQGNDPTGRISLAMTELFEMMFERAFSPLLWPDFIYKLLGKQKIIDQLISEHYNFVQRMLEVHIKKKQELREENRHAGNPQIYINILLDNVDKGVLTKDRVIAEVNETLMAGSYTSGTIVAWVFKLLGMFPDIQERAYQELKESCVGDRVELDDLPKLVQIEMIIKETLRHFGLPFTGRHIIKDVEINGKLTIPAGIQMFLNIHGLHHDPEYWEKPGEFYPEHFSPLKEKSRPRGAFIPFLGGPRVCPGSRYAMRSMKLMIASTLLRYKFSTDEKPPEDLRDMDYRYIVLLHPAAGFRVKIERR